MFRASTGGWHVLKSSTNDTTSSGVSWGLSTDVAAPADYDGDGKIDPAIFRPSTDCRLPRRRDRLGRL